MAEFAFSFAKYECNKHIDVIDNDKILSKTIDNMRSQYNRQQEWRERERNLF